MLFNIENELVEQKNFILSLIYDRNYAKAISLISFVESLWNKSGYSYKTKELKETIRKELQNEINSSNHWKSKSKWINILQQLENKTKSLSQSLI